MINIIFPSLGGDSQQEGLAGYRLGNAYEEIGDPETAILVRNNFETLLYSMHSLKPQIIPNFKI